MRGNGGEGEAGKFRTGLVQCDEQVARSFKFGSGAIHDYEICGVQSFELAGEERFFRAGGIGDEKCYQRGGAGDGAWTMAELQTVIGLRVRSRHFGDFQRGFLRQPIMRALPQKYEVGEWPLAGELADSISIKVQPWLGQLRKMVERRGQRGVAPQPRTQSLEGEQ